MWKNDKTESDQPKLKKLKIDKNKGFNQCKKSKLWNKDKIG